MPRNKIMSYECTCFSPAQHTPSCIRRAEAQARYRQAMEPDGWEGADLTEHYEEINRTVAQRISLQTPRKIPDTSVRDWTADDILRGKGGE